MKSSTQLASLSEPRRSMLVAIKGSGALSTTDLAQRIGISYEGARQQLGQLELEGWVERRTDREASGPGRPRSLYRLTTAGEHLFPKEYDALAVALLDSVADRLGPEALRQLLADVAAKKVERWRPLLEGKSFDQRLEALTGIYLDDDPFCRVEAGGRSAKLVEMNCPYLEVARRRPALCSVTVSVLRQLLGRRVVRSERFQDGCGRCVFQVLPDAVDVDAPAFDWEPDAPDRETGEIQGRREPRPPSLRV